MLELGDQEQELVKIVGPLKCELDPPSSWKDDLNKTGPLPGKYSDRRRYPRYHFRVCAALEHRQTFPALPRPNVWHKVFTKCVSRGGISFLHSEPLFPRERMQILLPARGTSTIEVVWCARIERRCFQVGARFVERLREAGAPADESVARQDSPRSFGTEERGS